MENSPIPSSQASLRTRAPSSHALSDRGASERRQTWDGGEMVGPGVIRLPETNIAPENRPSQTETSIETNNPSFRCYVSFRDSKLYLPKTNMEPKVMKVWFFLKGAGFQVLR